MTVVSGEVVLTQSCVATIAEQYQLTLPATLAPEPVSYDVGEVSDRRAAAHAELAAVGLLDSGEPSQVLVTSLWLLCRGAVEYFGYVATTQRRYSLQVASLGHDAVFAAMADAEVVLRPARPESMLSLLLAELPPANPAGGRSLSAAEHELRPPDARARATGAAPRGDARRILEIFAQPRLAGGQLQAGVRTGLDNRRVKSPDPVGFVDLEQGRWLTYVTDTGDGSKYVTAAPGRADTIATKLHESQQALV